MQLRARCYESGIFTKHRLAVPVVSIGNLTLGGSGKTPVVQYIAALLRSRGYHPAIVSRGYGGNAGNPVNVVSDGSKIFLDADEAGDEPRLLAENLPDVAVLTGPVRRLPAHQAISLGADIIILDDGFQHLALARDLDLVLFNADFLAGNSRIFPGGDLREPVAALNRCHGFILTGVGDENRRRAEKFSHLLQSRFPGRPVFFAGYTADDLVFHRPDSDESAENPADVAALPLLAFCGIARPAAFRRTLARQGIHPCSLLEFRDHHRYSGEDMARLAAAARQQGAQGLITTEKDYVKIRQYPINMPLWWLKMTVSLDNAFTEFVLNFLPA